MSTFEGLINEIPFISIDRFDGNNLKSNYFFLSHCHTDHMIGLYNYKGLPGPLFTSSISKVFVSHQFPQIKDIRCLEIGKPLKIKTETDEIIVTSIPAGHCPGSIMFLFETKTHRILYTGDFRMRLKDLKKLITFKSTTNDVLKFDKIYLDSTFFNQKYYEFPSQFESTKKICTIIKDWISRDKKNLISIRIPARYGSEYIFIEISKILKMKIHINQTEYEKYRYIPEMDDCITSNGNETQIHACTLNQKTNWKTLSCCNYENSKYIRVIKPSAMIWQGWKINDDIVTESSNEIYRVCYSSHASFTELKDMILYLKPKNVELNVIPEDEDEKFEMYKTLSTITNQYCDKNEEVIVNLVEDYSFKNIRNNNNNSKENFELSFSDDDNESDLLEIPVKRSKC